MADLEPRLVCVVVNWNGWQDTVACLDRLREQTYPNLGIIVVDNGSTNDSAARIREAHPGVTLLEVPRNLGFPTGCNIGTRRAYADGADLIWLLNNDTLAPPGTAASIVRCALANPGAGAIGAVLYYMHDPDSVQAWGGGRINLLTAYIRHFHAPASFAEPNTFLTGASLTLPRHVCESHGIFFEGFFMYCDDSDLCLRLHRAGLPLVVAEDTAILHKEGGSSPTRSPLIDQFQTTSVLRLLRRHAPFPALSMALFLVLRLMNRVRRREWENFAAVRRGFQVFWAERHLVFTDRL